MDARARSTVFRPSPVCRFCFGFCTYICLLVGPNKTKLKKKKQNKNNTLEQTTSPCWLLAAYLKLWARHSSSIVSKNTNLKKNPMSVVVTVDSGHGTCLGWRNTSMFDSWMLPVSKMRMLFWWNRLNGTIQRE